MVSSPVRMTLQMTVPQGQATAITTALQSVMLGTRREIGCVACSLASEVGEQVVLRYEENWETEGDLGRHLRSDLFVTLAGLVECALERPRLEFTLPTGTRGLDYADEVRARSETGRPSSDDRMGPATSGGGAVEVPPVAPGPRGPRESRNVK